MPIRVKILPHLQSIKWCRHWSWKKLVFLEILNSIDTKTSSYEWSIKDGNEMAEIMKKTCFSWSLKLLATKTFISDWWIRGGYEIEIRNFICVRFLKTSQLTRWVVCNSNKTFDQDRSYYNSNEFLTPTVW